MALCGNNSLEDEVELPIWTELAHTFTTREPVKYEKNVNIMGRNRHGWWSFFSSPEMTSKLSQGFI